MTGMKEVHARMMAAEERLQRQVFLKDEHIVICVDYEYNIPLDACRTHKDILAWVLQLAEKTWMTMDVMERFILVACQEAGLDRPRS